MKTLLLLALLPLLLFSCKGLRDGTTVVEGQVVDKYTGAAIADATVSVMQNKTSSSSAAYSHKRSFQTDSEGRFSFSFDGDKDYHYILMGSTPLGYYTDWNAAPSITSGRKNKDVKVPAQGPAWVRVNVINEMPLDPIFFYIWGFKDDWSQAIYLISDTSFVKSVDGGKVSIIPYRIRSMNGVDTYYNTTVQPQSLDTVDLEIKY